MPKRPLAIRWLPTIAFAGLISAIAGHFSGSPEVPAGRPFSYAPPTGFGPLALPANVNAESGVDRVWAEPTAVSKLDPRVTLSHTPQEAQIEDAALGVIADGMPALYEKSHGKWSEERHVVHVRPDGAKVGLIVGHLVTADESQLRTMQMIFPDDTGTSIATASFDSVSAARLVPLFEKSLDASEGIKKLGKKPENWVYLAYFAGLTLFGILLQLVIARRADA